MTRFSVLSPRPLLLGFFLFLVLGAASSGAATPGPIETDSPEIVDSSVVWLSPENEDSLAREEAKDLRESGPSRFRNSITFSPFHLLGFGSVEAMYERALGPGFSVAAFGGYGVLPMLNVIRIHELGGQVRYYPSGRGRHAVHYGVEGFWARTRFNFDDGDDEWDLLDYFKGRIDFVGGGPFFGYKYTERDGFTIEFQGGYQAAMANGLEWISFPIANFNIGKSF